MRGKEIEKMKEVGGQHSGCRAGADSLRSTGDAERVCLSGPQTTAATEQKDTTREKGIKEKRR